MPTVFTPGRPAGTFVRAVVAVAALAGPLTAQDDADLALVEEARAIHERVLTLDSHVDINPRTFTAERNYTQELDIQVDLPKMREGGLDGAFFVVYVPQRRGLDDAGYQNAYDAAIEKFDAIHRLTEEYAPDEIELALTAGDVRRIAAAGKRVALVGVENAYPIGDDLSRIREFHQRGARYMSLAHNGHNQFADSNSGEEDGLWTHGGLSESGIAAIGEMNRLGIMVDISHLSREATLQALSLSRAPVIASHSAVRSLVDHPRNLDDAQLEALAATDGVAQIVAYPAFVKNRRPDSPERDAASNALREELGLPDPAAPGGARLFEEAFGALTPDERAAYRDGRVEINERFPTDPPASVSDFADHIDYAVGLIGVDHVGIASDFNNGEGVTGWFDASATFNVTLELVRRGYSEEDIAKLWGENLLRVMEEVQRVGRELGE